MFIGIDLGTSSVKLMVMGEEGQIAYETTREYPVKYPKALWAEQDPLDWWNQTLDGLKEVCDNIDKDLIKAIGFSGQMHGLVTLDEKHQVLHPAMLWCDQRTQEECDDITAHFGSEKLSELVGNKALTGFTAPKIIWLKKHQPDVFKSISMILLPKDYVRYCLTGDFATDYSDASGMLLLDVENKCYSKEMLSFVGLEENQLPKLYESYEVTGKLTEEVKDVLGITQDVLVVGGAGDQAAGAIGSGVVKPGAVSVTLGTSGVVFATHEAYKVDEENRLHAFCHANGEYHTMGVMISAASCLKWWNEEALKHNTIQDLIDELPEEVDDVIFLPYLMGERTPYADPNAKGVFFGMSMTTDRASMTKAVLEGVAFGLKDSLDLMNDMNLPINEVRVLGGGSRSKEWKQIIADVFGHTVYDINTNQGGALGAAILAAVGAGKYESVLEATDKIISTTNEYKPDAEKRTLYIKKHHKYKMLYRQLKDLFI